jgi:hypothetical protein
MKVQILDSATFSTLNPANIEKYLSGKNWRKSPDSSNDITIWDINIRDNHFRIWLPLSKRFVDYSESISRLVKTVSQSEDRSEIDVLDDLETIAVGDVLRIRTYDEAKKSSTSLPLKEGIALIEKAKNMTLAAAFATEAKRPVYNISRSNEISTYMNSLRLGQTERGSYKIKIISPLPLHEQLTIPDLDTYPFERKVMINLMSGLEALYEVSKEMNRKGDFNFAAFQEVVDYGVSANLCEAISSYHGENDYKPIDIDISWSYLMHPPKSTPSSMVFDKNLLHFVSLAAKEFREQSPERISIEGYVKILYKDLKKSRIGKEKITIVGTVLDKTRSVHMAIKNNEDYNLAIDAHKKDREVSVDGILKRSGNYFSLLDIKNFHIVD